MLLENKRYIIKNSKLYLIKNNIYLNKLFLFLFLLIKLFNLNMAKSFFLLNNSNYKS